MLTLDKFFSKIFCVAKFYMTICCTQYFNMTILNMDGVDMNVKCDGMIITDLILNLVRSLPLKKLDSSCNDTSKCTVFCF